jgi:hypothetical protein
VVLKKVRGWSCNKTTRDDPWSYSRTTHLGYVQESEHVGRGAGRCALADRDQAAGGEIVKCRNYVRSCEVAGFGDLAGTGSDALVLGAFVFGGEVGEDP